MKIAIYWEQEQWGGVDSHLRILLSTWTESSDEFVLFYNKGNLGLERIKESLNKLVNVKLSEISSYSYNEMIARQPDSFLLRCLHPMFYFVQPLLFVIMVLRLKFIFKNEQGIDVFLANNGGYPAAWGCLSALIAAKRIGINTRVLLVHHEATSPGLFMRMYEYFVDKAVANAATAIICPSQATLQSIIQRRNINNVSTRLRVIYNEVCHDTPDDVSTKNNIRNLVRGDSSILIGIVGRIQAYKGHEDIICAISRLDKNERDKIKLLVIGSGEEKEVSRLKQLSQRLRVNNNVCFLGYMHGDSTEIIKQLDMLIVATRSFEGFGLTLAEAMLVGTPVLATNVGAIPEFIDSSVGAVIPPNSPKKIAESISEFVLNPEIFLNKTIDAKSRIKNLTSGMSNEYRLLFLECSDNLLD